MYRTLFLRISLFIFLFSFMACADVKKEKEQVSALPYYNTPDFSPIFAKNSEEKKTITHTIADFSFKDQHGDNFTLNDLKGKIHVADFIFTSCGSICPVMTANMKIIEKEFKNDDDVQLLSYSVTPWIDDVKRLSDYAKRNEIDAKNWHFLTGDKNEIYTLARRSYFAEEDLGFSKDSKEFLHTEHVILVDANQHIRGIYNGTLQLEMQQLAKDIKELKKEL